MNREETFRSGFVSVLGRPNVGKSSLVNALVGRKVTIVSPKPQTTRRRVQAVLTTPEAQIVFVDTPGIQRPRDLLGRVMARAAAESLTEVDAVLMVIDAVRARGEEDRAAAALLGRVQAPTLLVVNKIDLVHGAGDETAAAAARDLSYAGPVLPVSAVTGQGLAELQRWIIRQLGPGPKYFPDGMRTDQSDSLLVAELIREQVLLRTGDEVPHATAIVVEEMAPRLNGKLFIRAAVVVERESQKAIVIGAGGRQLKEIGRNARANIEHLLGEPIFLDLWVRVDKGWRDSGRRLREFGYESE